MHTVSVMHILLSLLERKFFAGNIAPQKNSRINLTGRLHNYKRRNHFGNRRNIEVTRIKEKLGRTTGKTIDVESPKTANLLNFLSHDTLFGEILSSGHVTSEQSDLYVSYQ